MKRGFEYKSIYKCFRIIGEINRDKLLNYIFNYNRFAGNTFFLIFDFWVLICVICFHDALPLQKFSDYSNIKRNLYQLFPNPFIKLNEKDKCGKIK
jgi:hypothetical protein